MQLYDESLPSLLAFQHEMHILPTGHIGIRMDNVFIDMDGIWHVPYKSVVHINDDRIAPFRIASFDIECLSFESYQTKNCIFPDFKKENDCISQIGTCIMMTNNDVMYRYIFVLEGEKNSKQMDHLLFCILLLLRKIYSSNGLVLFTIRILIFL